MPQVVLAFMCMLASVGLVVFAVWRPVQWLFLRPLVLWFAAGSFLLYAFNSLVNPQPVEVSLYVAHVTLVAVVYLLLPMRQAALVSLISVFIMLGVAYKHPALHVELMVSFLGIGLLVSFLTMYGQTIRAEQGLDATALEPAESSAAGALVRQAVVLERIKEFMGSRPAPQKMALLLLEVELLENLTDVYGPLLTSQLMEQVSRSLRAKLPGANYLWRFGESRFLVLLSNQEEAEAQRLAELLMQQTSGVQVRSGDPLSLRAGMAFLSERASLEDVLALAQARLYRARRDRLSVVSDSRNVE